MYLSIKIIPRTSTPEIRIDPLENLTIYLAVTFSTQAQFPYSHLIPSTGIYNVYTTSNKKINLIVMIECVSACVKYSKVYIYGIYFY